MRAKPYSGYKRSGVEWLGDVPKHWQPIALKWISIRYSGGTPDRSNDLFWDQGTIPWINSGAVNQNVITEPSALISEEGYRNSSAKWIPKGALVIALAGQGKTKGMVAQAGLRTTCNQSMAAIVPKQSTNARFLYWLLASQYEQIRNMAGGEQRDGLNLEILGSVPCLALPIDEQRAIAAFLDREMGKIDTLIVSKRTLIERLTEKRTALISRTVTRGLPSAAAVAVGLDSSPRFKSSGIECIGKVPSHWEIKPFRYLMNTLDQGWSPVAANWPADDTEWGVLKLSAVRDGHFIPLENKALEADFDGSAAVTPCAGDLLISRSNTPDRVGDVCLVPRDYPKLLIPDLLYRVELKSKIVVPAFICLFLLSRSARAQIESDARGSSGSMVKLGQDHVRDWKIPCPPLLEQLAIADYISRETQQLDRMVEKIEEAIERLHDYRAALITAAVTGKIDVRGQSADNRPVLASPP